MTEQQLRNLAKKQNLKIKKSRGAYSGDNYGGYMIINALNNTIIAGEPFNMNMNDVEKFLKEGTDHDKTRAI